MVLEVPVPRERAVGADGLATRVTLFPSMFSCGLKLHFPHPVCEILHRLGLALAQFHPNAWWILICYCILWHWALLRYDPEHVDLTYYEFLLTHDVKMGAREICSFRGMHVLVVLELRYRKVSNWTGKFFFLSGRGWEFLVG